MTHPSKDSPKEVTVCNKCQNELEYNSTYGTGRICEDCSQKIDEPNNCSFSLDVNFDSRNKLLFVKTTVSHDEPDTVHIPPEKVIETNYYPNNPKYFGLIALLEVKDNTDTVLLEDAWFGTKQNVLSPREEVSLNINHKKVLGCDGSRSWKVIWGKDWVYRQDDLEEGLQEEPETFSKYVSRKGSPNEAEKLIVNVWFPSIEEEVSESTLSETINISDQL